MGNDSTNRPVPAEIPSRVLSDAAQALTLTNRISAELDAIEGQLAESGYDRSCIDSFIDHLEASVANHHAPAETRTPYVKQYQARGIPVLRSHT